MPHPHDLILITGRIIDSVAPEPLAVDHLRVVGDRIADVGGAHPSGAEAVIDATDLTLLPGLIDAHVHLLAQLRPVQEEHGERPTERIYRAIPHARATLDAGFTTVRDGGGTPAGLRTAIREGIVAGPDLQVSVGWLSQTGGHGDSTLPSGLDARYVLPDVPLGVADGVDGVRRAAREMIRHGADWLKICTTGGVMSPVGGPDAEQLTLEEVAAAVQEARAARIRGVMAHAIGAAGIRTALRAGVRSIEHGCFIDEEGLDLMAAGGAFLVPTLHGARSVLEREEAEPGAMAPWALAKVHGVLAAYAQAITEAARRGVPIALGTDAGIGIHGTNGRELAYLVDAGLTPMQAIVAATRTGARLLGVADDRGTLRAGARADIIGVAGDPTEEIALLGDPERVRLVIQGGRVVKDLDGRFREPAPATRRAVSAGDAR